MDNKLNKVFPSFSPFNPEFLPGNTLIDIFPNCFSFYLSNRGNNQDIKSHLRHLDNITIQVLLNPYSAVVVSDASIKTRLPLPYLIFIAITILLSKQNITQLELCS